MTIYTSTIAFAHLPIQEIIKLCAEHQILVEFSSGLPYNEQLEQYFIEYPYAKLSHNYFPAPKVPFVLNLASSNQDIRKRSIDHCINGLRLTKLANAPFYAAHAGFCIDPDPAKLGKKLNTSSLPINKHQHWELFIQSVQIILQEAQLLEVDFYIENNVIAAFNIDELGQNPLLCCDEKELTQLVKEINHDRFGILLDTAHLKVSAQTLNFDLTAAMQSLIPSIKAIHHSDNNGKVDSNDILPIYYWFLPYMFFFKNIIHVLEVKKLSLSELRKQHQLLQESVLETTKK